MKQNLLILALFLAASTVLAQGVNSWTTPKHEVKFVTEDSNEVNMNIDPGFEYADLKSEDRIFRLFFHKNNPEIKNARIVDQQSKLMVARGKGNYFLGTARFEFVNGEIFRVKRIRNANGHEIIGPYGTLFKVENRGIAPVQTLNELDFLAQAFFVFEQIKKTQQPPSDVIYHTTYISSFNRSN